MVGWLALGCSEFSCGMLHQRQACSLCAQPDVLHTQPQSNPPLLLPQTFCSGTGAS